MPTSLAPAQGCVVAMVDAAQVFAKGIQLVYRASGFVTGKVPRFSCCSFKSTPMQFCLIEPWEVAD